MSAFIELGLSNVVVAGGLAIVALVVARCCKNPTLIHGLWALVILKLLTPPLWSWSVADVPILPHVAQAEKAEPPAPMRVVVGDSNAAEKKPTTPPASVSPLANASSGRSSDWVRSLQELPEAGMFTSMADWVSTNSPPWSGTWIAPLDTRVVSNSNNRLLLPSAVWNMTVWNSPPLCPVAAPAVSLRRELPRNQALGVSSQLGSPICAGQRRNAVHINLRHMLGLGWQSGTGDEAGARIPKVRLTDTSGGFWFPISEDGIDFETIEFYRDATLEQPVKATAREVDYFIVMTSTGSFLVLAAETPQEESTDSDGPLAVDVTAELKPKEPAAITSPATRGTIAPSWTSAWGTRLAHVWRNWRIPLAWIWGTGSLLCLALAVVRIQRFRRLLARTDPAPERLVASALRLAQRIGVRRLPIIRLAPGVANPLVWRGLRNTYIVLPAELLRGLTRQQAATLVTHELAHLRRHDHIMRWLELAATILYWWNPLLWIARRQLRECEERCCDAWVVWAMPQATRDYLDTVLKTVDFLSQRRHPLPATATGMAHFKELRTRFQHVIENHAQRREHNRLSRFAKVGMLCLALALLPLVPTLNVRNVAANESVPAETELLTAVTARPAVAKVHVSSFLRAPVQVNQVSRFSRLGSASVPSLLSLDSGIACIAVSPRAQWLAIGRKDGSVEVRAATTQTGDESESNNSLQTAWRHDSHSDQVSGVAFSSDGRSLASISLNGRAELRDVATGDLRRTWRVSENWLTSVAFSPSNKMLVVGGYDRTVRLYNIDGDDVDGVHRDGSPPQLLGTAIHSSAVRALSFGPGGHTIAAVDSAGMLKLWSCAAEALADSHGRLDCVASAAAHHGVARDVAFAASETRLATVGEDGRMRIWTMDGTSLVATSARQTKDLLTQVGFGFDDRMVFAGGWQGGVQLYDAQSAELLKDVSMEDLSPLRGMAIADQSVYFVGGQEPGLSQWKLVQPLTPSYVLQSMQLERVDLFAPGGTTFVEAEFFTANNRLPRGVLLDSTAPSESAGTPAQNLRFLVMPESDPKNDSQRQAEQRQADLWSAEDCIDDSHDISDCAPACDE